MIGTATLAFMAFCAAVFVVLIIGAVSPTDASAHGNPPGTTCTGYRYGKGGGKTCIRWSYPTTTVAP